MQAAAHTGGYKLGHQAHAASEMLHTTWIQSRSSRTRRICNAAHKHDWISIFGQCSFFNLMPQKEHFITDHVNFAISVLTSKDLSIDLLN